jgi:hypothetical protein
MPPIRRCLLAIGLLTLPCPVLAQQVANAIYDDAKAVISELIEEEAARALVPNLTCRLDAVVHIYFASTLQRIYDRQFGELGPVVRGDIANVLANGVVVLMEGKDLENFIPRMRLQRDRKLRGFQCEKTVRDKGGPAAPEVTSAILGADFTPMADGCNPVTTATVTGEKVTKRFACEAAELVKSAVVDDELSVRRHLLRAGAIVVAGTNVTEARIGALADRIHQAVVTGKTDGLSGAAQHVVAIIRVATGSSVDTRHFLSSVAGVLSEMCGSQSACSDDIRKGLELTAKVLAATRANDILGIADWFLGLAIGYIDAPVSDSKDPAKLSMKLVLTETAPGIEPNLATASASLVDYTEAKAVKLRNELIAGQQPDAQGKPEDSKVVEAANMAIYRRLLLGIGGYALEAYRNGSPSEAAREAFRASAVEALRSIGSGSGFRRTFWLNVLVPQLALRTNVSSSYAGVRGSASVDFGVFRFPCWYTDRLYMAFNVTVFDFLGPLSELAMRDAELVYFNEERVWANFFTPRVEYMVGFPGLSEHLVASAGAALRPIVADPAGSGSRRYRLVFDKGDVSSHLEFGLSIKYLF